MWTDYYQITMAYAHWKKGTHNQLSAFQLYYRKVPFEGRDVLFCGLGTAIDYLRDFQFTENDIDYLKSLDLFEVGFLNYLRDLKFTGDVNAVLEGCRVLPKEPMFQIVGPIALCQILETPLLNILNFQSLVATKAARIREAAGDDTVVEFGLRRAQGFDGALSASRAAYVGGCDATSNLEAAMRFGIPAMGTMSHAWVMSFPSELEAFEAYAKVFPNSCMVAVDTYDTIHGVENAIRLGDKLKGIRLDSGDLDALSKEARRRLDSAGLTHVKIIASGDLDEYKIEALKQKGAPIDIWGVGTKLITAYEEPALTGVYKLARVQGEDGVWRDCHKTSNDDFKATLPGFLPRGGNELHPIFNAGKCIYQNDSIQTLHRNFRR